MPNKNIRRSNGTPTDFTNRANANDIYVDSATEALYIGSGSSGTSKRYIQTGADVPVAITASTALTTAAHSGRPIIVNAAAGLTLTLPAATGSGAKFLIYIGTLVTSNSFIVQAASGTDYFRGIAFLKDDGAGTVQGFATANTGTVGTESDTLTWNRTTTGTCIVGDLVEFQDIATAVWSVKTANNASGTEATPFSAAVA